jgi:hypothetical protein
MRQITLSEAKDLAAMDASRSLEALRIDASTPILAETYLEAEYCWIFFRNKQIEVPAAASLHCDWAYAVSKRGTVRQIVDLSEDPNAASEYLRKMSTYFKDHGL